MERYTTFEVRTTFFVFFGKCPTVGKEKGKNCPTNVRGHGPTWNWSSHTPSSWIGWFLSSHSTFRGIYFIYSVTLVWNTLKNLYQVQMSRIPSFVSWGPFMTGGTIASVKTCLWIKLNYLRNSAPPRAAVTTFCLFIYNRDKHASKGQHQDEEY